MYEEGIIFDPVCGMTIELRDNENRNLTTQYSGTDYHFCSTFCRDIFETNPEYFIKLSQKQYGYSENENDS